jgi:hypothetical protein
MAVRFAQTIVPIQFILSNAGTAAVGDAPARQEWAQAPSYKFEFSILNSNLMVPPNRHFIFNQQLRPCAPQKVQISVNWEGKMS